MDINQVLALIQAGELLGGGAVAVQAGLLLLTLACFVVAMIFGVQATKASDAAREARAEATMQARMAENLAYEVRALKSEMETLGREVTEAAYRAPEPAPAEVYEPEAEARFEEGAAEPISRGADPDSQGYSDDNDNQALEAAKVAASVPSSILRGRLRRR
ncbi:MAG: hypothetical protein AAGB02_08060 [Pseudomonadota bacterium]